MAYVKPFIRLSWGGTLLTDEIWANNMHIIEGFDGQTLLPQLMGDSTRTNAIRQRIVDLHSSTAGSNAEVALGWVKFALIGTDGKYIGEPVTYYFADVAGGYIDEPRIGGFTSAAISFRSAVVRGPAANGRVYPPANAYFSDLFTFSTARQGVLLTAWADFIRDVNDIATTSELPVVLGNVSASGNGAQAGISQVRVGNVMDVQRRRKNKIRETYVTEAI